MTELYPEFKSLHIALVLTSGGLFLLRGAFVATGATWPMTASLRYLSYSIDTLLVASAAALLLILPVAVYQNGWLVLKLLLLPVYVVLGSLALKRGRTLARRRVAYGAALLVLLSMYAIARTHHPLGPWLFIREWLF